MRLSCRNYCEVRPLARAKKRRPMRSFFLCFRFVWIGGSNRSAERCLVAEYENGSKMYYFDINPCKL